MGHIYKNKNHFLIWLLSKCILVTFIVCPKAIGQQIVPDNTLPENSDVNPDGNIINIDGGTTVGNNLFHSFEQFSVPANNTASFNNVIYIDNIFSRVTGNFSSEINGIIRANDTANLFLINPNGIIFGENASLNIGGSFFASTAETIIFEDGIQFSSSSTNGTQPLLTITAPIGLGFGATPHSIINRSVGRNIGLRVEPDRTLALVGGDISIEGGFITTLGGRIELGSVAGNNNVSLTPTDRGWVLGYEGTLNFQDISISQAALIASQGDSSGDIQIQGRRVILTEGSQVFSRADAQQAGNVTVRASESVELEGNSADAGFDFNIPTLVFNDVRGNATGEGSKLTVETERLIVKDGAQILARTFGSVELSLG